MELTKTAALAWCSIEKAYLFVDGSAMSHVSSTSLSFG